MKRDARRVLDGHQTTRHAPTAGALASPFRPNGDAPAIDVRLDGNTVWLSQQQLADLFQTSRTNVVEHIANIYAEGELDETATCREFRQVRTEGVREVTRTLPFYNLDLIISLGYRVRSRIATAFRIWATERLREYLVKGFTMDDARLLALRTRQLAQAGDAWCKAAEAALAAIPGASNTSHRAPPVEVVLS